MTDAIAAFLKMAETVQGLERRISAAKNIPDGMKNRIHTLRIVSGNGYYEPTKEDLALAESVKSAIAARAKDEGQAQKRDALHVIAVDIESMRGLLPQMAAKACIELGVLARQLEEEAKP